MNKSITNKDIECILGLYGFNESFSGQEIYLQNTETDGYVKFIFGVTLESGKKLVIKLLREGKDLVKERQKMENQSAFSEFMRGHGISTPAHYPSNGAYCATYEFHGTPCNVTVEDWCGEEITEITTETACEIGALMARMHTCSLENQCEIGTGTLFCAAYWNDVDAFPEFCEITKDARFDQAAVERIKMIREEKLERIRAAWETLPKAAVQGDVSINNLTRGAHGLTIFDYNNAGNEVLVSDLVMEGLLTAYEMDLPEGVSESCRETLFPSFLKGYLSVRTLTNAECAVAWDVYTLYHGLWFTRIVYSKNSLDLLVKKNDLVAANRLLSQMLADMTEEDDGRFRGE